MNLPNASMAWINNRLSLMAQGLGIAVAGPANQLLMGYNLLSMARSFGRDYGDLDFRLRAEKRCLKTWAKAWALDHRDRSDGDIRFAIDALARISTVLAELLENSSNYSTLDSGRGPRIRDGVRALCHSISGSLLRTQRSPQPVRPDLTRTLSNFLLNLVC